MNQASSKIARIMAILQLCIAFTIIIGAVGYPFMGELFAYRSKAILYHNVMGDHSLAGNEQQKNILNRNKIRFNALPESQKRMIQTNYQKLKNPSNQSFKEKVQRGLTILAFELPAFERAWLLLSIVISILVLLNYEGVRQAVWLLPLVVICYSGVNRIYGEPVHAAADASLFPSEEYIVNNYLKKPLSNDIVKQHDELKAGWEQYLVKEWAFQLPLSDKAAFERQKEKGEFAFNLARLDLLAKEKDPSPFNKRESTGILLLYFGWNLLFAYVVNRNDKGH